MAGTVKSVTLALTTVLTTNVFNNPSALVRGQIRKIAVVNKTGSAATFSLWKGASGANAAGTEVFGIGRSVAANSSYIEYCNLPMASTDFLVGGANTATALTLTIEYEEFAQ